MEAPYRAPQLVNNAPYESLGDRWYDAKDDPVALLRAESRLRNPWITSLVDDTFGGRPCDVLDIGCGAGFLSNHLARKGHRVTGIDSAGGPLTVAARHDSTCTAVYIKADALALPFEAGRFDVVCAMDFLEHVETPERAVAEAARVLAPQGLFFFHTFNRTWLSWIVAIRGVEWFVKNTPPRMHVLRLFIKPEELSDMCLRHGLLVPRMLGSRPRLNAAFFKMMVTGTVADSFEFTFTRSMSVGFTGVARKRSI